MELELHQNENYYLYNLYQNEGNQYDIYDENDKKELIATINSDPITMKNNSTNWDLVITPYKSWFNLDLMGIWRYRDLIRLFIRRDIVSQYKQTVLGPLYFALTPIISTLINMLIFGK